MSERIRPREVSHITSLSQRKVQELAAAGKLPSAAKLGGVWTFEERAIRAWITQREQSLWPESHAISTSAGKSGGDVSKSPDESIEAAYAQLIPAKRRGGSRGGGTSSSARR